jgi:sarcosine oxidase
LGNETFRKIRVVSGERCIVVGAGLLGLSASWALTRRGWQVRVLDAGPALGHERSGSKGDARIFRLGYPEPHYVEMALRARVLWRALEASSGRQLLHEAGQLSFGDAGLVEDVRRALEVNDAPCAVLSTAQAADRFPFLRTHGAVVFEPDSGVLAADACLRALSEATSAPVEFDQPVTAIEQRGDAVTVMTAHGDVFESDVAVVCAGPSTLVLVERDATTRAWAAAAPSFPQVAYFRPHAIADPASPFPVFIEWGDDMVYGLPVPGRGAHEGTYKLACHRPGPALEQYDPSATTRLPDDPGEVAVLADAARRLLPAVDPRPVATERCVYDNAADSDFVLDRVGRVVVGCGTSGHGFKFGPLLGEMMADLAGGTTPPVDLTPFRLGRGPATTR